VSLPFARRGLTLESCSAFFLPRLLGLARATHLAATGGAYAAADPLVRGLFSALLPTPAETLAHAVGLASEVAENTSLTSTKLMRDLLVYGPATPEEAHRLESRVFLGVVGSRDNLEGVKSFVEKRRPEFGGRFDREVVPVWPWWGEEGRAREGGGGPKL
jgi:enoyl-CoA hydratase/carnithine racemase